MNIHKGTGFQNENIGLYGVFRTLDIPSMTRFMGTCNQASFILGGGFGIDENLSLYEMIVDQYRKLLTSVLCSRNNYPYYKSLGY